MNKKKAGAAAIKWCFPEKAASTKHRDPVQAELFKRMEYLVALIREAIQNILDQATTPNGKVRVRILLASGPDALSASTAKKYFSGGLRDHVLASDKGDFDPSRPCAFIVIEDTGTTGLLGDVLQNRKPPLQTKNHFFFFWRVEGKSDKRGAQGGRRGVGKILFTMCSEASAFFGYTVRAGDTQDQGAGLLMGQATLANHELNGVDYEPDGSWGFTPNAGALTEPIRDPLVIDEFRRDWHISRAKDQPGLSLVIPYLRAAWSIEEVVRVFIREFLVAVQLGRIEAVIETPSSQPVVIDESSIRDVVLEYASDAERERLVNDVDALAWLNSSTPEDLKIDGLLAPHWKDLEVNADQVKALMETLKRDERIAVSVPVRVKTVDGTVDEVSGMTVLISREDGLKDQAMFIRTGILIPRATRGLLPDYRVIALVTDEALATMLGDAEGGAHEDWNHNQESFKGKYEDGPAWLRYVKHAPREILNRLVVHDQDRDYTLAADVFSLPLGSSSADTGDGSGKPGSGGGKPGERDRETKPPKPKRVKKRPTLPPAPPSAITFDKLSDGFAGRPSGEAKATKPKRVEIALAYNTGAGDPFTQYDPNDFDLTKPNGITFSFNGCEITMTKNTITVDRIVLENFNLRVTGFDPKRDLLMSWEVK